MARLQSSHGDSLCQGRLARHITLASIGALLVLAGGALAGGSSPGHRDPVGELRPSEDQLEFTLRTWYESLANTSADSKELAALLSTRELAFTPEGRDEWSEDAMRSWIVELRSELPQVRFALSKIHVDAAPDGAFHAHFEVDRAGVDAEGNRHVMRREQSWRVDQSAEGRLLVLEIEEKPLLVFPGSGPQIVCY